MTIPRRLYDELDEVHGMVTNCWAMRKWPGQGNLVALLGEAVERFTKAITELSRYRGEFLGNDGSVPDQSVLADAIALLRESEWHSDGGAGLWCNHCKGGARAGEREPRHAPGCPLAALFTRTAPGKADGR
jgi:hypothetical protein